MCHDTAATKSVLDACVFDAAVVRTKTERSSECILFVKIVDVDIDFFADRFVAIG